MVIGSGDFSYALEASVIRTRRQPAVHAGVRMRGRSEKARCWRPTGDPRSRGRGGAGAKAQAREQIAAAVAAKGFGHREVLVRINALDSPWWKDDMAMAAKVVPDGILVPRCRASRTSRRSRRSSPR